MKNPAILSRSFYEQSTKEVAKQLLGKIIVRGDISARITETEAYVGSHDLASHSKVGVTKRTITMFGPAGHAYVYLIYGMYYCLNIVTEKEGNGCAVLIRSIEQVSGPGRVCKFLKIDKTLNDVDITKKGVLYIVDGPKPKKIFKGKRIGIDYAGKWKNVELRFYCS